MDEDDVLLEVRYDILKNFIKKLSDNFPDSLHAYSFIDTLLKWKKNEANVEIHILAPNGEPNSGVVFFIVYGNVFTGSVYAPDEEAANSIRVALEVTNKVPYLEKEVAVFTCLNESAFSIVKDITESEVWETRNQKVLWLPWYVARELVVAVPEDVELRELSAEHAELINQRWPQRHQGSEELIRTMTQFNLGVGVFRGEALVSWALLWYFGGIGSVQTVEGEKQKGYGLAAVAALTKRMGEMQMDVHMNVLPGNKNGEKFFRKLGFRYAFDAKWVVRNCAKLWEDNL